MAARAFYWPELSSQPPCRSFWRALARFWTWRALARFLLFSSSSPAPCDPWTDDNPWIDFVALGPPPRIPFGQFFAVALTWTTRAAPVVGGQGFSTPRRQKRNMADRKVSGYKRSQQFKPQNASTLKCKLPSSGSMAKIQVNPWTA